MGRGQKGGTKEVGSDTSKRGSRDDFIVASRPGTPLEPQPFMEKPGKESSEKPSEWSRGEKIQHGGDGEEGMPTRRGGQIQDV